MSGVKKLTYVLAAVFSLLSTGVGVGYGQAVNRTLNPGSVEQVKVLYEALGWHVAAFLAVPLLGYLAYGFILEEHRRDNYWLLGIWMIVLGIAVVVIFPFTLLYQRLLEAMVIVLVIAVVVALLLVGY
jgi:hypothetical protein